MSHSVSQPVNELASKSTVLFIERLDESIENQPFNIQVSESFIQPTS
jgi:hypothetical protein